MTKDEVIRDLDAINTNDREAAHGDADDLILKFLETNGFEDVAEAWHEVADRCGGFWYA